MTPESPSASAPRRAPSRARKSSRTWPLKALGFFLLITLIIYLLVFLTGTRQATPKLGIDLQGGTRITLVPQGQEPTPEQLSQARTIMENRVNGMGVSGASVITDGNTLVITIPGEDATEAQSLTQSSQLVFRPVAMPGQPNLEEFPGVAKDMAERWVRYGILSAEDATNYLEETAQSLNAAREQLPDGAPDKGKKVEAPAIEVEPLPDPANSIEATERRQKITAMLREDRQSSDPTVQIAAAALLRCHPNETDPLQGTDDPAKPLVACDPSTGVVNFLGPAPVIVDDAAAPEAQAKTGEERLTGAYIDTNKPIAGGYDEQTGQMQVSFTFSLGGGAETWAKLTRDLLNQQVAITLDSEIISAPRIQSPTPAGSSTAITGSFTQEEAQGLANNLRYGALPLSFAGENGESGGTVQTIPPSLGEASLKAGLVAGIVGLIAIAVFVFVNYRLYGLISLFTLACSGVLVYGSLVLLGRWIDYSLDLSGIAGVIIGIGATADSFVVIYERIKDDVREGHTFRSATLRGWERAKRTIVTGNMVTLIGSVVIYFLAVGEVKGFAFTLGLTTVFDLVVTFLVTAPLMLLAAAHPFWAKPSVNGMAKVFRLGEKVRARSQSGELPARGEDN